MTSTAALLALTPALLAQGAASATDPISGGAGWVGAGLLGLVLGWLLWIHLPAKDKQIAQLIESRDALIREQNHGFRDAIQATVLAAAVQDKERRDDYKASLQIVVTHCERETAMTGKAIREQLGEIQSLAIGLRQLMEEFREDRRRSSRGPTT